MKSTSGNQALSQKQNLNRPQVSQQQHQSQKNPSQNRQPHQKQDPSPQLPSLNTPQQQQQQWIHIRYNYNLAEQPPLSEQQKVGIEQFLSGDGVKWPPPKHLPPIPLLHGMAKLEQQLRASLETQKQNLRCKTEECTLKEEQLKKAQHEAEKAREDAKKELVDSITRMNEEIKLKEVENETRSKFDLGHIRSELERSESQCQILLQEAEMQKGQYSNLYTQFVQQDEELRDKQATIETLQREQQSLKTELENAKLLFQEKEKLASGYKRTIEQQRTHIRKYGKKFKEMEAKCKDLNSQKDKAVKANSTLGKNIDAAMSFLSNCKKLSKPQQTSTKNTQKRATTSAADKVEIAKKPRTHHEDPKSHRLLTNQRQLLLNNPSSQNQQTYEHQQNPSPQLPSMNTSQHQEQIHYYNYNLAEQPKLTEQQGVEIAHFLCGNDVKWPPPSHLPPIPLLHGMAKLEQQLLVRHETQQKNLNFLTQELAHKEKQLKEALNEAEKTRENAKKELFDTIARMDEKIKQKEEENEKHFKHDLGHIKSELEKSKSHCQILLKETKWQREQFDNLCTLYEELQQKQQNMEKELENAKLQNEDEAKLIQEKEKQARDLERIVEQQRTHIRNYGKRIKELEDVDAAMAILAACKAHADFNNSQKHANASDKDEVAANKKQRACWEASTDNDD